MRAFPFIHNNGKLPERTFCWFQSNYACEQKEYQWKKIFLLHIFPSNTHTDSKCSLDGRFLYVSQEYMNAVLITGRSRLSSVDNIGGFGVCGVLYWH